MKKITIEPGMGNDWIVVENTPSGIRKRIETISPESPPRLYNIDEAAKYLCVSRRTFARYIKSGRAPKPYQIVGKKIKLWLRAQLDAMISQ